MGGGSSTGRNEAVAENDTESKYGTPVKFDPNFKGPIANRGCTDIICCLIFIAFIVGLVILGGYAWRNGNPNKLIYPTDYRGQICGYDEYVKDRPYLFYFDLVKCASATTLLQLQCPTKQICVSECPTSSWTGIYDEATYQVGGPSGVDWGKYICEYETDPESLGKRPLELFEYDECAAYYFESTPLHGRCIPSFIVDTGADLIKDGSDRPLQDKNNNTISFDDVKDAEKALAAYLEAQAVANRIFNDFNESWMFMLAGSIIGMLVCLLWIFIMRWIAGIMVWLSIMITFVLLGIGIYCCASEYTALASLGSSNIAFQFTLELQAYFKMKETWLTFTIILSVLTLILLLLVIFLCNRIRLAIALIKEGSRAISNMMFTLLWPIIPFILEVALFGVWIVLAVFLATSNSATYKVVGAPSDFPLADGEACDATNFDNNGTMAKCVFIEYSGSSNLIGMQFYALLGLFWLMNFIVAFGEMALAGAFASYYWAFNKPRDIPALPITKSVWRALRYHLGSLAFGSLLIALVQLARVTLEYIDQKLKGAENKVARFLLKCMKCCLWCLEKFLRFLNKNAYIMIAIYGKNFCTSAKNAFFLLMRNIVRVVVLDKIVDFLLFMSKLMVSAGIGVISFFFFTGRVTWYEQYLARYFGSVPTLNYFWVPIVVICVLTYMIASVFFSVYNMAIDTLFLCFLEDLERNDGSAEKPYYMNKELRNIASVKNQVKRYKL